MNKRNPLVRVLAAIWSGVDGFRKILHLLLLLFIFAVFLGTLSGTAPLFPDRAALLIQPAGAIVEELAGDPYDRAIEEILGETSPQTRLQDIVDALEYAKDDDRIEAVHLELSGMGGAGLTKLQRIAEAIEDFKTSGKPVIASADFFTQHGYYVGAHADEVYTHPDGGVLLQGYGRFRTYFRDAIDLLKLDWNIFRVGTHKSFVEPFERMSMSDEDREATGNLIDQLWDTYSSDVAAARGLLAEDIDHYANDFVDQVTQTKGDLGTAAVTHELVDGLLRRGEVRDLLIEHVGADPDSEDDYNSIGMYEYLSNMDLLNGDKTADENIAVIVASGNITSGSQPPGSIGADSTSQLLRRARNDDSVKAIVLRVDSGGGSAFASEVIGNEIAALQDAGKPVVASMSSVAASGGYWISVGADRVFASPTTITGSIGIFGMFPTYQRTVAQIGVATDGIGSNPLSGELRPDREMAPHTRQLVQLVVEDGYDDFISHVAMFRGLEKEAVDAVAQGRVWTGADALRHGLIDEHGDLEDAIAFAAEIAGLEEGAYGRKDIRLELSATEQLIVDLLGTVKSLGLDVSGLRSTPSSLEKIAGRFEDAVSPLLGFDDPKGVYAHCFCDFN
ncbi:MAG: signal peptide peptidase SppA [Woeseiaceae bacterium]